MKKKSANKTLGNFGESIAADYLKKKGFRVLEQNVRTRFGEIDLVAEKKKRLYLVEVKTRTSTIFGSPIESLPYYRINRLKKLGVWYLSHQKKKYQGIHLCLLGILKQGASIKIDFIEDITG